MRRAFPASNYRTKPYQPRYSKVSASRATLELLWILRTLLMRRTFLILLLLAALGVSLANGTPKPPAKSHRAVAPAAGAHRSGSSKSRNAAKAESRDLSRRASSLARAPRKNRTTAHSRPSPLDARPRSSRHSRAVKRPRADGFALPAVAAEDASFRKTQLLPMPSPLRGSLESLVRQNDRTEEDGLERIQDDDDLNDRISRGLLVPVPVSAALTINGNLPENRRYCRPWTAIFLSDLARAHAARFHSPIEVSSAVRTVEYQRKLMEINGNAAGAEGEVASPHLTGATIDIAKQGMSRQQIAWMRSRLLTLQQAGKIDVEEEFRQACFHITVYKSYLPPKPLSDPSAVQTEVPVEGQ